MTASGSRYSDECFIEVLVRRPNGNTVYRHSYCIYDMAWRDYRAQRDKAEAEGKDYTVHMFLTRDAKPQ